jgi:hypothetical protein
MPYLDEYMTSRANINRDTLLPAHFTGLSGTIPFPDPDRTETLIDHREAFFSDPETVETYERWGIPFPSEEEISTLPKDPQKASDNTPSTEPDPLTEEPTTTENDTPETAPTQLHPQSQSEKQVRKNCAKSKNNRFRKNKTINTLSRKVRKQEIARKSAQKHHTVA